MRAVQVLKVLRTSSTTAGFFATRMRSRAFTSWQAANDNGVYRDPGTEQVGKDPGTS
jgi:hypothetical protein